MTYNSNSIIERVYLKNKDRLNNTALVFYGKKITYKKMFKKINRTANSFKEIGVKKGDIVTILPLNTPEFLYCYYALNMLGAVINAVQPLASVKEIERFFNDTQSKFIVCSDLNCNNLIEFSDKAKIVLIPIFNSMPFKEKLTKLKDKEAIDKSKKLKSNMLSALSIDAFIEWKDFIKLSNSDNILSFEGTLDDTAIIVHTGGTTGVPKGIELSNKNGIALVKNHEKINLNLKQNQSVLGCISITAAFGFIDNINIPLNFGMSVILEPLYSQENVAQDIARLKPNVVFCVPSFLEYFVNEEIRKEQETGIKKDFSYLDVIIIGGQKLSENSLNLLQNFINNHQIKKDIKTRINTGYGASEISAAATCTIIGNGKQTKVGKPFPDLKIKIVDTDTNAELPNGEIGEVCICGDTVMKGYYNAPLETENVLKLEDGNIWYHTGDIGYLDDNLELDVISRKRRMITTFSGYKIATTAVEDTIEKLEYINSCVVVATDDINHKNCKAPKAYITLKKDMDFSLIDNEIKQTVISSINERNALQEIVIIKEIPITKMGKKDFQMVEILDYINSLDKSLKCEYRNDHKDYDYCYAISKNSSDSRSSEEIIDFFNKAITKKYESERVDPKQRKSILFIYEG